MKKKSVITSQMKQDFVIMLMKRFAPIIPEEIFKMKFDVIISNPPYQLSDGGNGNGNT